MNRQYHRHFSKYETVISKIKRFKDTGDDLYLDDACFEMQQCLEFMLKGLLLEFGIKYPNSGSSGHDIRLLMDIVKNNIPFYFEKWDRLYDLSSTITYWETHGRYGESIKVKINVVEEIKNIINDLNETFLDLMNEERTKP